MTTRSLPSTTPLLKSSGSSKTHALGTPAPLRDKRSISPLNQTGYQGKPSLTNHPQAIRNIEQTYALERHYFF